MAIMFRLQRYAPSQAASIHHSFKKYIRCVAKKMPIHTIPYSYATDNCLNESTITIILHTHRNAWQMNDRPIIKMFTNIESRNDTIMNTHFIFYQRIVWWSKTSSHGEVNVSIFNPLSSRFLLRSALFFEYLMKWTWNILSNQGRTANLVSASNWFCKDRTDNIAGITTKLFARSPKVKVRCLLHVISHYT